MSWNFNIEQAPQGEVEVVPVVQKDRTLNKRVFKPVKCWTASRCKKVFISWILPDGRWNGYTKDSLPLAWKILEQPDFPEGATHDD